MSDTMTAPATAPLRTRRPTLAEQSTELRLAVMRVARRLRQERADTDISATQLAALGWIASEGPITLGRIAELERVTPPSMNRTVNRLVDAGYVTREGSPDDGRKVLLRTTEAGAAIVRETRRRRDAWIAKRFSALSPDERETLAKATTILGRLADQ
ncbi:MarR family winged helix-turn-helix transcriptional regulator [Agromyces aerolatus]|uniref:MarR family winged helix-turn-helix transcriptional regulator n=1 Tax=Agromyces sp. LY-1074 TaxID=3074080 RepID=UPI002854BF56|nr:MULTISPECIES: MarR family transcriptional regulator [unclassified Agromyces]MDR5700540.1 MarR family transcriptional regulator [Agromyces sp. LY-1074]MDR5707061.1 MarR family transcriptional regulator [Agromyces sp. LY-1358]